MSPQRSAGFTLVEMLITVAIIGILAAIAYPSYQAYVQQSRRADVMANMAALAQTLERAYSTQGQYPSSLAGANAAAATDFYDVSVALTTSGGRNIQYTMTATAKGVQTADTEKGTACTPLTFNSLGEQTPAVCWNG